MSDPLRALFKPAELRAFLFPANSRYHGVEVATIQQGDRTIAYLRRRFVPQPERLIVFKEHEVKQGERIDQIAANDIGDPEQLWRIADANRAIDPQELTEDIGRVLRITLPEGTTG
jgi:hypothetical protein